MRNTKQRKMILEIINNSYNHPTAYMVYQECTKILPNISLGTVYRNLNTLVSSGEIQRLDIPNQMTRYDKLINHLVSKYILIPSLTHCLIDSNIASQVGKGTDYGVKLYYKYRSICNRKYVEYYLLKMDIHKFFASIDVELLKKKISKRIKEKRSLDIVYKIIDSNPKTEAIEILKNYTLVN